MYKRQDFSALGPGPQADGAARRVVPHTVGKQVVHRPAEQEGVCLDLGQRLRRQIHLEVEALPHAAVEKVGGGLAEERLHLEGLFPQGLHGAVQPHGEIQVVHQIPDLLAPVSYTHLDVYKRQGVSYSIRLSTLQVNSTKAGNFVLQAAMLYGAVVLMVICLTVLSLQQLLDAGQYRYRFSVLRKLGVEEGRIGRLVLRQLGAVSYTHLFC